MKFLKGLSRTKQSDTAAEFSAIGLEFGQEQINLVQLQTDTKGQITLHASATMPYPGDRDAFLYSVKAIKSYLLPVLKQQGFNGRKVVTVLPSDQVRIMSVSYQTKPGQSDEHAIVKQVDDLVDGSINEYVIDYLPVRKAGKDQNQLAIVALSLRSNVMKYLETMRHAGFDVQALDMGPAAIKRLVSVMHQYKEGETVMVINFGSKQSYLSMISGQRLLFDGEVEFCESELVQQVADTLQLEFEVARSQLYQHGLGSSGDDEALSEPVNEQIGDTLLEILRPTFAKLANSVRRAKTFALSETHGKGVKDIYLVGGIARWRGVQKVMGSLLNLPVRVIPDPLAIFSSKQLLEDHGIGRAELAVATGLALREKN
jgi:type IV pilus assembly protein PilM